MIETLGSPWMAYTVLVIVTVASRLRCGSWLAPAAFVGLIWSFFAGASLLVVDYPIPGRGLWMLVLLVVAIQLGALIAHELAPRSSAEIRPDPSAALDSLIAPCRQYGLLCMAVAMMGCVYFLFISLEQFDLPFTPLGVLEVGAKWTLLRYDDGFEPWSVRLLVTWFHPAALLGGMLFVRSRKRRDRALALFTLLPAAAYSFLTAARAPALLGLTCWLGGYLAMCCVNERGRPALFAWKRAGWFLTVAAFVLLGFVAVDGLRNMRWAGEFALDARETHITNYVFGPPAAFADWYAHQDSGPLTWGNRTFAGLYALLGLSQRVVGVYLGTSNLVGTEVTNVYTAFRMLVEDFAVPGAFLASVFLGFVAGLAYSSQTTRYSRPILFLSAFYAFILFSPLQSLFSFNGTILAWIVAAVAVHMRTAQIGRALPMTG